MEIYDGKIEFIELKSKAKDLEIDGKFIVKINKLKTTFCIRKFKYFVKIKPNIVQVYQFFFL